MWKSESCYGNLLPNKIYAIDRMEMGKIIRIYYIILTHNVSESSGHIPQEIALLFRL